MSWVYTVSNNIGTFGTRLVYRGALQLIGGEGWYLPNKFSYCPSCTVSIVWAFHKYNRSPQTFILFDQRAPLLKVQVSFKLNYKAKLPNFCSTSSSQIVPLSEWERGRERAEIVFERLIIFGLEKWVFGLFGCGSNIKRIVYHDSRFVNTSLPLSLPTFIKIWIVLRK